MHACTADTLEYADQVTGALQARRGKLVAFIGNEINLPWIPISSRIAWLKRIQADMIATQLLEAAGQWLYAECGVKVISLPHALNTTAFEPRVADEQRSIDLGTRVYRYLPYVGDSDRNAIYDFFVNHRGNPALVLDFSTEHRLDRQGWADFLNRCKGTISTEAGTRYLERDDASVLTLRALIDAKSSGIFIGADSWLHRIGRRLPHGVKGLLKKVLSRGGLIRHEAIARPTEADREIAENFFATRNLAPVYTKCISSRHFDAIGTGTVQIMFPGRYNDILIADKHYLMLKRDFSNAEGVLERFRDPSERKRVAGEAHDHILSHHTYRHRIDKLLSAVGA